MKDWWKIAFAVAISLLASGLILLVSDSPRGEPITLRPPPTAAPLVLHVTGAVLQPGVYRLPQGSRIEDAVQAAGGLLPSADIEAINLAELAQDGQQIRIPVLAEAGQDVQQRFSAPVLVPSPSASRTPISRRLVKINSADQVELESLPGIGPVLAQAIIAYRQEHGPFQSVQDLLKVPGIGLKTLEKIKDYITVDQ